jgi:AcrR family transcriptional regulator
MLSPSTAATRTKLIHAAEQLFTDRGLDAVSLNEITKLAGQRNASALQYHFGGKDGLVQAILEKHQPGIAIRRHQMIDAIEANGDATLHALLSALVLPIASKLQDTDGGPQYVSLMAQLISKPGADVLQMSASNATSGRDRLMRLVQAACPAIPAPVMQLRAIAVYGFLFHALADFTARTQADSAGVIISEDTAFFAHNLRDCLVAMLTAPVSSDTAAQVPAGAILKD